MKQITDAPFEGDSVHPSESLRFGAFLAPYHPLNADPALQLRRDIDLMEHLDHLGFDEAWMGEHHSTGAEIVPAPDVFIAAAAERTQRLRFGTGVVSLPYDHPLVTVDRITQLDLQTRGRLIFGTGPGKIPLDAHMMGIAPSDQRRRQGEALEAILALLRGDVVNMSTDRARQGSDRTVQGAQEHSLHRSAPPQPERKLLKRELREPSSITKDR